MGLDQTRMGTTPMYLKREKHVLAYFVDRRVLRSDMGNWP